MTAAELIAELQKLPGHVEVGITLRVNNSVDVVWRDLADHVEIRIDSPGQIVGCTIAGRSLS